MRENRIVINIVFWTTLITLVGATFFSFCENPNPYITNFCFAIFGSSLLALIVALSGYFSARKRVQKMYADIGIEILNTLGEYKQSIKIEDIKFNAKIIDEVHQKWLSLGKIYFDYSPFNRKSKLNLFIYSLMQYIEQFVLESNKHLEAINCLLKMDTDEVSDYLINEIVEIEKYMFVLNKHQSPIGVEFKEVSFAMRRTLYNYLSEYVKIINRKHKGIYMSIKKPNEEELQNNKTELENYYKTIRDKIPIEV